MALPAVSSELAHIKSRVENHGIDTVVLGELESAPTTVEAVCLHIRSADIVHLACHRRQDSMEPLNSAFLLQDGSLGVQKLMEHENKRGGLAYLSACETAMVAKDSMLDEPIHLATTFLFAGFRGVVATLWSDHYCCVYVEEGTHRFIGQCRISTDQSLPTTSTKRSYSTKIRLLMPQRRWTLLFGS